MLPFQAGTGITNSGTPDRLGAKWKRNFANPDSELPAQAPVPTHRYKPREVRRQGYPRESRSPSRRVVVKLGSWSACADGAPRDVERHLHVCTRVTARTDAHADFFSSVAIPPNPGGRLPQGSNTAPNTVEI